jgi:hypothetical protein
MLTGRAGHGRKSRGARGGLGFLRLAVVLAARIAVVKAVRAAAAHDAAHLQAIQKRHIHHPVTPVDQWRPSKKMNYRARSFLRPFSTKALAMSERGLRDDAADFGLPFSILMLALLTPFVVQKSIEISLCSESWSGILKNAKWVASEMWWMHKNTIIKSNLPIRPALDSHLTACTEQT